MGVRYEKVVLDLEDRLSSPTLRAAAAVGVLDNALDDLDGSAVNADRSTTRLGGSSGGLAKTAVQSREVSREVDRMSGRIRLFADAAAILGPALVPIGAVLLPAMSGLAAQFGAAALGAGTMLVAFQGVGDALKVVNEAALEPTVENLVKARDAMAKLSPEAREFVRELQDMRDTFSGLRDAAAAGLFPGLTSALEQFEVVAPRVERVLTALGDATGDVIDDFAGGLSGSRGMEFMEFIRTEVPDALRELGETMGNFTAGLAEMWMAFTPLNRDFSGWLLEASESFDRWASGLAETEGFENFVEYIRTNGPRVAEAMGAIGNALVNIVTAAAPLGGPVLAGIEALADLLGTIAGSDAGPPIMAAVGAMALLSRSTKVFGAVSKSTWGQGISGAKGLTGVVMSAQRAMGVAAAGAGLLALSLTDLDEKAGLSNTAMGALVGTMIAPGVGTAIGGLAGMLADLAAANDALVGALDELDSAIDSLDTTRIQDALADVNDEYASQVGFTAALSSSGIPGLGEAYDMLAGKGDEVSSAQRRANVALAAAENRTTDLTSAYDAAAGAGRRVALMAARQAEALKESREAARDTAQEFRAFGDNLDDAKVSLSGWIRSLERQAEALRNFRLNAERAANRGLRQGLIKALQEAGPEGALRMKQLADATKEQIGRANDAWRDGQREANRYTDAVGGAKDAGPVNTKVTADIRAAMSGIGIVTNELNNLNGKTAVTYVETRVSRIAAAIGDTFGSVPAGADGMTVPGQRAPYGDKVLAYLAPGEEVISNRHGQADRHREVLRAINSNRYAAGGTVERVYHDQRAYYSSAQGGSAPTGPLQIVGTLNTPWGPAEVRGIARAEARQVVSDSRAYASHTGPRSKKKRGD